MLLLQKRLKTRDFRFGGAARGDFRFGEQHPTGRLEKAHDSQRLRISSNPILRLAQPQARLLAPQPTAFIERQFLLG
ncbi:MAG: hypothetical protein U1F76_04620 [Candidatus Competibacteraceae bacterium]